MTGRGNTFPPHLDAATDFCCDHNGYGCGHHIDGHGHGESCFVPGCVCRSWRDHVSCDHRQADPAKAGYGAGRRDERSRIVLALMALRAEQSEPWYPPKSEQRLRQAARGNILGRAIKLARGDE